MVRETSIGLGIGLIIWWLVGLSDHAAAWLTWLDGIAALCAFGIGAAVVPSRANAPVTAGGPIALSIGLFVLWLIGLATHAQSWLAWWTFVFACAFLAVGVYASTRLERRGGAPTTVARV